MRSVILLARKLVLMSASSSLPRCCGQMSFEKARARRRAHSTHFGPAHDAMANNASQLSWSRSPNVRAVLDVHWRFVQPDPVRSALAWRPIRRNSAISMAQALDFLMGKLAAQRDNKSATHGRIRKVSFELRFQPTPWRTRLRTDLRTEGVSAYDPTDVGVVHGVCPALINPFSSSFSRTNVSASSMRSVGA